MRAHVSNICRAGWSFIYRIGKIRSYLDEQAILKLIHAFMTSRSDSCNSHLIGLPTNDINRLQRLQNAAARLVCRVKRHEHITPILQSVHWLPVSQRIINNTHILTFKALHNLATPYMTGPCSSAINPHAPSVLHPLTSCNNPHLLGHHPMAAELLQCRSPLLVEQASITSQGMFMYCHF